MKTKILPIILGILLIVNILGMTSALTIKSVSSNPEEAQPGEVVIVSIEIENTNNYDVENIKMQLILTPQNVETGNPLSPTTTMGEDLPFAPYQSGSEKFLDRLKKDDEENIKFKLIVLPQTISGIYKVPVEITYEGNGVSQTKNELISIAVNSKPNLKISVDEKVVLISRQKNIIPLKIVNSGLADAKFLYVKMGDYSGIQIFSEKEQYIGDISSDDFDSIEYEVYIKPNAANEIIIPITLNYKDSTNKEYSIDTKVVLKTYSLEEARKLGLVTKPSYTYYIIASVVVVFYIVYRIIKRQRKKKKLGGR